jgi:uncharacterized protein
MITPTELWLTILAFGAAVINGAVGYGFSSTVTPIAILWYSNKVLNPALVIVEVVVNIALLTRERKYIRSTWPRAKPVAMTLLPGVILGTFGLEFLAVNDVKLIVYAVLLPLVALQLYGFVRPFRNERRGAAAVGPGIGFLYALTTISGPPLALFLRNQGMSKHEFRCTIAQIRVAESGLTLSAYLVFDAVLGGNLVSLPAIGLLPFLFAPVLVGVPLGTLLLARVSPEFFRRFVMAVDGLFVSYGMSQVLVALRWISKQASYLVIAALFLGIAALAYVSLRRLSEGDGTSKVRAALASSAATSAGEPPPEGPAPSMTKLT